MSRDRYEHGARIVTTRGCAAMFRKGQAGTVEESARDGNYRVRFDEGGAWWLNELEFKRMPDRRRNASLFEAVALAWTRFWRGGRA
ncbi:hypothetical protein [Pseudoxanthomonas sp. PXM02]|uniref:hypothetical protein n=1 Tax=Pseudoxanthomonas sp. PXM02 TaxID=2769294 RepID=UPI0017856702|nr:hypothetical protein [Pseudoxanthomonas sp. PXM02]MBD9478537.1 hypothetical protein [Pseudoxanthomonas sp. PXM02]